MNKKSFSFELKNISEWNKNVIVGVNKLYKQEEELINIPTNDFFCLTPEHKGLFLLLYTKSN